jgi:hypothetical protein
MDREVANNVDGTKAPEGMAKTVETLRKALIDISIPAVVLAIVSVFGLRPIGNQTASAPVNITVVGSSVTVPTVRAVIFSAPWCVPCKRYLGDIVKQMSPVGWVIADVGTAKAAGAHILIDKEQNAERLKRRGILDYPTTIIERDGVEVLRFSGYCTPDELADLINAEAKKER